MWVPIGIIDIPALGEIPSSVVYLRFCELTFVTHIVFESVFGSVFGL